MYEVDPVKDLEAVRVRQVLENAENDFTEDELEPRRADHRTKNLAPFFEEGSRNLSVPHIVVKSVFDPPAKLSIKEWVPIANITEEGVVVYSKQRFWQMGTIEDGAIPRLTDHYAEKMKLDRETAEEIGLFYLSNRSYEQPAPVIAPPDFVPVVATECSHRDGSERQTRTLITRLGLSSALYDAHRRSQDPRTELVSFRVFVDGQWEGF